MPRRAEGRDKKNPGFSLSFPTASLRALLVLPFMALLALAVGVTGLLSFLNGQMAVEQLTNRLAQETMARLGDRLRGLLGAADDLVALNGLEHLSLADLEALRRHFWHQLEVFPYVDAIFAANCGGDMVGVERLADGGKVLTKGGSAFGGCFEVWQAEPGGGQTGLVSRTPGYDPRQRPFYQGAAQTGRQVWTDLYYLPHRQQAYISVARPVYGQDGQLEGVLAAALSQHEINTYLRGLDLGKGGLSFIMEPDGRLVAVSTGESPLAVDGGQGRLLSAAESANPLVRQAYQTIQAELGPAPELLGQPTLLEFDHQGQAQFLHVIPFDFGRGIHWLVGATVPQSAYMRQIWANTTWTLGLCAAALLVALVLGLLVARSITRPVGRLVKAAGHIAAGDLAQRVDLPRRGELGELAHAFNHMAARLQTSFRELEAAKLELEDRVRQRTRELRRGKELLDETQRIVRVGGWEWEPASGRMAWTSELYAILEREGDNDLSMAEALGYCAPEQREQARLALERVALTGGSFRQELEMVTGKGRRFWARFAGRAESDNGQGERVIGVVQDISQRKEAELERERLILELKQALAEVRQLSGLLPICANCKKIRNDEGYWDQIENYLLEHTGAQFTHGICPECTAKLYPELNQPE
ncbi:MAG: HAMP domain-containing protein [Thermodesulfobacteriota bacterium]